MPRRIASLYFSATLGRPRLILAVAALVVVALALFVPRFRLDVSAESLVLENDTSLAYYRSIRARFGSDDFLVVTYRPRGELFAPAMLATIAELRRELAALDRIEAVRSLLDVPLLQSPPVDLGELREGASTLLSPRTDRRLARQELAESPLYSQLLLSKDGRTTALYLNLRPDTEGEALRRQREALRKAAAERPLDDREAARLAALSERLQARNARLTRETEEDIGRVRAILDRYRAGAEIHLAGVPLIVADMIRFIRHDLRVFGSGVFAFIVVLLALSFRRPRWVLLPVLICAGTGLAMVGLLGLLDWPVTVVSSSFAAVLLIVTLSLVVHLIVRYQELHTAEPGLDQRALVEATIRSKFIPSLYTAATTMVAFGSLTISGLRPVIDFGWIMVIGTALAFVFTFLVFPAGLALVPAGMPVKRRHDPTGRLADWTASLIAGREQVVLAVFAALVAAAVAGAARLSVDNRFIDYFDADTGIHQGMLTLDRELGGTTPLDVVIDAPAAVRASRPAAAAGADPSPGAGFTGTSYWLNLFRRDTVLAIHDYLDALPQTGKVLSVATALRMLESVSPSGLLDDFTLSLVHRELPADVRATLFDPYISDDGDELRFAVRIFESSRTLDRDTLLRQIRADLGAKFGLAPEQVRLTGMAVLYNNVLQSLFRSQAMTVGFVFLVIMGVFVALFRSLRIAALAIVPNLAAAALILGLMGWLGIDLDIVTVTIAAITLGIGVDDTIHYTHRFVDEFARDRDDRGAIARSHRSVGRAMIYTSVAIALGFSILALSSFIPTRSFGLLTGCAMVFALAANLTLLPALFSAFRPLGPARPASASRN